MTYLSKPNGHFLQTCLFYFNRLMALDMDNLSFSPFLKHPLPLSQYLFLVFFLFL